MTTDRFRGRAFLALAGVLGALAVAAGAFASHGLAPIKGARAVELWTTASHYQMVHAAALLGTVLLMRNGGGRWAMAAAALFAAGAILFPGALYLLGWFGPGILGAVAPAGGLCLIGGWICLAVAALRR